MKQSCLKATSKFCKSFTKKRGGGPTPRQIIGILNSLKSSTNSSNLLMVCEIFLILLGMSFRPTSEPQMFTSPLEYKYIINLWKLSANWEIFLSEK
uniref:Uncharacterized protein n=1 Tax=Megaselia scalaris TaxID=36166 RepID=T1H2X5_MEGSC